MRPNRLGGDGTLQEAGPVDAVGETVILAVVRGLLKCSAPGAGGLVLTLSGVAESTRAA